MSKHTPGPWLTDQTMYWHSVFVEEDGCPWVIAYVNRKRKTHALHNARLIASAPDLLDALCGALDSLEYVEQVMPGKVGYGVRQERIAKARAAIAKATGND